MDNHPAARHKTGHIAMPESLMRRPFLAALLVAAAATPALAQTMPQISVETMKEVTKTLSSDAFEG
ncbi:hypothetical protein LXJ58_36475, partial [Escherichia coli]|nr:hypothetical protein [Escherichia coli]